MSRKKPAGWQERAETFKVEAERLPYGAEREALERKARQLKMASHLNQWVSSRAFSRRSRAALLDRAAPASRCSL
jgi:hypothetical protein